jgi:hypothetical protein
MTVMGFSVVETYHTPLSNLLNARLFSWKSPESVRKKEKGENDNRTPLLLNIFVEFILKLIYAQSERHEKVLN